MNPNPKYIPGKGNYGIKPATCVFRNGAPQELTEPRYCTNCRRFVRFATWGEWPLFCCVRCEDKWFSGN